MAQGLLLSCVLFLGLVLRLEHCLLFFSQHLVDQFLRGLVHSRFLLGIWLCAFLAALFRLRERRRLRFIFHFRLPSSRILDLLHLQDGLNALVEIAAALFEEHTAQHFVVVILEHLLQCADLCVLLRR